MVDAALIQGFRNEIKENFNKEQENAPYPDQRTKLIKQNGQREFIIAFVFRVSAASCLPGNWALSLRVRKGLKQLMWSVQTTSNILGSFSNLRRHT